jgi:hypothetical protein
MLLVVMLTGALHLSQAQQQQQQQNQRQHLLRPVSWSPVQLRPGLVSQALKCQGCCSLWREA